MSMDNFAAYRKHASGLGSLRWARKCLYAISDQGLISGSNFLSSLLLARWLAPEEYGEYALAISGMMLLTVLHQAVLLEPMVVFGPTRYSEVQGRYFSKLLALNWWFSGGATLACAGATMRCFAVGNRSAAMVALAMVAAVPCMLLFCVVRGACYLRFRPRLAMAGSAIYAATVCAAVVVMHAIGVLTPATAIGVIGFGSVIVSCVMLPKLRADMPISAGAPGRSEVLRVHLGYGVWAIAAGVSVWVSDNVWYWVVDFSFGMAHVGALRAMGNLTLPIAHLVGALSRLALPHVSEALRSDGIAAMRRVVYLMLGLTVAGSLAYLLIIALFHESIVAILYRGRFTEDAFLSVWLVAAFVVWVGSNSFHVGLRALQAPSCVFAATAAAAAVSLLAAFGGATRYGLHGIGASIVFSALASLIVSWRRFEAKATSQYEPAALEEKQFA